MTPAYSADAGALVAVVVPGNETELACVGGNADFAIPAACFPTVGTSGTFNGPGTRPGCSTYDAGVVSDAGNDAGDADVVSDAGDASD